MVKSYFAIACFALFTLVSLGACDGEDSYEKQLVYFEQNREFIREKKVEKDENGAYVYTQLVTQGDTVLYRVKLKEGTETGHPSLDTKLTLNLEGNLIDGTVFQRRAVMNFAPKELIDGLREVLLHNTVGETVEAIIPAPLGYKYVYTPNIPAGSTLIFNYTIEK